MPRLTRCRVEHSLPDFGLSILLCFVMSHFTEIDRTKLFLLYHLNPVHPKAPSVPKGPLLQIVIIRHGEKPTEGQRPFRQRL